MGYLGRRIGKSQDTGNPTADGTGGGILDLFTNGYFQRQGNVYNAPGIAAQGLTATGGVISDYTDGPAVYRAHVFTSTGTFDVSALGDFGDTVEYLVVAGGGGGGCQGSGGGAGGYRSSVTGESTGGGGTLESVFPVSPGPYTITVGAGGAGGVGNHPSIATVGSQGTDSYFGPPSTPNGITATKGGGGSTFAIDGSIGGSGGGGDNSSPPFAGLSGTANEGYPGGAGSNSPPGYGGGGGGGSGGAGAAGSGSNGGVGGLGLRSTIAGPVNDGIGAPGPGSPGKNWFAGGGGGSTSYGGSPASGGGPGGPYAGGGTGGGGASNVAGTPGTYATGSGGGAGNYNTVYANGGSGGSGIVVVRYQIAELTATAKATGGAISYYGGKTIHTFTSSGTFANTSGSPLLSMLLLLVVVVAAEKVLVLELVVGDLVHFIQILPPVRMVLLILAAVVVE